MPNAHEGMAERGLHTFRRQDVGARWQVSLKVETLIKKVKEFDALSHLVFLITVSLRIDDKYDFKTRKYVLFRQRFRGQGTCQCCQAYPSIYIFLVLR